MDTEKTLLQQIRDKEQEFSRKIDAARADAEAAVAAARTEAEDLLCTADKAGKASAEQVYWNVQGKTAIEIEALNTAADLDQEAAMVRGEKNIHEAAERIVRYVIME
jgi:vacuolar-type H+-ATPase subunit H